VTWTTAASNEAEGQVQLEYLPGVPRQAVQVLALTGHYAIIAEGDDLLVVPRIEGGDAVAGRTPRDGNWPGGAEVAYDAGIIGRKKVGGVVSWGAHIRIRGTKVEIIGTDATDGIDLDGGVGGKKVVRHGDPVIPTAAEALWKSKAAAVLNALVAGTVEVAVTPIGNSQASTTKVGAG
jgi:hypothetical protein